MPGEAFFGLGTASAADTVVIQWPDGSETSLADVPSNQVLTVELDDCQLPADLHCDGIVGIVDFLALLGAWGSCSDCGNCLADFDGDCSVRVPHLPIPEENDKPDPDGDGSPLRFHPAAGYVDS